VTGAAAGGVAVAGGAGAAVVAAGVAGVAVDEAQALVSAEKASNAREVVSFEVTSIFYRCARISQRSGKSGRPTVLFRYSAPLEPPVPVRVPIVRSTIFT
jgi:hypothetical protein